MLNCVCHVIITVAWQAQQLSLFSLYQDSGSFSRSPWKPALTEARLMWGARNATKSMQNT